MRLLLVLIALIMLITAAPIVLDERGLPIPPSKDPFYVPPSDFASKPVGTILRTRKMDNPFGIVIIPAKIKEVYQFLVRSEDTFGNATAIATSLYVPRNGDPNKLLSYQAATDASNVDCSPSYAWQLGANPQTIVTAQIEQALGQAGLNQGWYVVVPDDEGLKATYTAGYQAGKAVLNSIRAVLSTGDLTGISKDAKVTLWGYSGGTTGTAWAALLESTYAADLKANIIGYAVGGIIADIALIAAARMGGPFAGFVVTAMNGLAHEYPVLDKYLHDNVYPDKIKRFTSTNDACLIINTPKFLLAQWSEFFPKGKAVLQDPVVKNITDSLVMKNQGLTPIKPMYFYNSILDEIIPAGDTDALHKQLCLQGASILYNQDLIGGHVTQAIIGSGAAFSWLKDRFAGKVQTGCKKNVLPSNIFAKGGLSGLGTEISSLLLTILGKPLGPNDIF